MQLALGSARAGLISAPPIEQSKGLKLHDLSIHQSDVHNIEEKEAIYWES
jgi:hypothetical protein